MCDVRWNRLLEAIHLVSSGDSFKSLRSRICWIITTTIMAMPIGQAMNPIKVGKVALAMPLANACSSIGCPADSARNADSMASATNGKPHSGPSSRRIPRQSQNMCDFFIIYSYFQRHGSGDPTPCGGYPGPACSAMIIYNVFC